jgi:ATP phosphoribosyltransferase regulatory subunit
MPHRSLLQIPPGVQCFYGAEARLRRFVEGEIAAVFRGWSYEEVLLPLFDYLDVFARAGGESFSHRIYRFIGRDGEVLALRPDFTALVAKVAASRLRDRPLPLRLFYSGEVLRYEPPRAGRQEELYQIGLEHVGNGLAADVEVLLVALEALDRLGIRESVLTLGHAGFVSGLLADAETPFERRQDCLEAMGRRDTHALRRLVPGESGERLAEAVRLSGRLDVLDQAQQLSQNDEGLAGLDRLRAIARELDRLGLADRVQFDLGEVRDLAYYTGMTFEIHAPGAGLELGAGGRYDRLLANFGWPRPAVGFSLSLDRLAALAGRIKPDLAADRPARELSQDEPLSGRLSGALEQRRAGVKVRL